MKTSTTAKPATTKTAAAKATAAPASATVTQLVPKSKIDMARGIFDKINHADYKSAEGSSPRKDFIAQCVSELGMTDKGASTYWQNLRNEASGEPLYKGSPAPTGLPRGRKPDHAGRLQKAAAKVQKLQSRVADDMEALKAAQTELVEMATGDAAVTV